MWRYNRNWKHQIDGCMNIQNAKRPTWFIAAISVEINQNNTRDTTTHHLVSSSEHV